MKKIIFIFATLLIFFGCRDRAELSMERGEYFYNIGKLEDAVLEYKKVINSFPNDISNIDFDNIQMLANAHHNLAVILFKRGYESSDETEKTSYLYAAKSEAITAYELVPKDTYKETWDKIQKALKQ